MKPQKSIHISFSAADLDLYYDIMRESTLNLIPTSTLIRHYLRKGKKAGNFNNQLQANENNKSSAVSL